MTGGGDATGAETTERQHGKLGLAGNLARQFIGSPLTPLLLFAFLAAGFLGLILTPRQENPQISVPMVDIFVSYPGNSPAEVARMVTDPLQRIMSEITDVKHVYSVSQRGQSMVTVRFKVGQSLGPSLVKVYDKLASNMNAIPPGASQPLIRPKGINDVPVVTFTLWSKSVGEATLGEIAREVLQRVKEVPDTGQSFIVSGPRDVLSIDVEPDRLAAYGLTPQQVAGVIRSANTQIETGRTDWNGKSLKVISGGFLRSPNEVSNLIVGVYKGQPVYLSQIAHIKYGAGETHSQVQYYTGPASHDPNVAAQGLQAVTVAVAKKAGSNGVSVAYAAIHKVESLKGSVIPSNVHVSVTRNYGKTANDKVNELIFKLFEATIVVSLLVLVALGWRAALVVLIVIPTVILITIFAALLMHFSINRVSLFAFIFAIGILVDDTIVVVENAYRRWLKEGETSDFTLIDAVREVGNPTVLATFTVIAALLPMAFVRGMMGPYMAPIPVLGSVAMLFSLFAAFVFTPWLILRFKPNLKTLERMEAREHRQARRLHGFFSRLIVPLVEHRWRGRLVLLLIVVAFFASASLMLFKFVPFKMLPNDNSSTFSVVVNMPAGTALPVTANVTHEMTEALRKIPEVTALQTYVGTAEPFSFNGMVRHYYLRSEPWQAQIHVELVGKHERSLTSNQITIRARTLIEPIAKAHDARIVVAETPPGPPVQAPVVAEIYGPSAGVRDAVARQVTAYFDSAKNLTDVGNTLEAPHDVWRFHLDRIKAGLAGVQASAVNKALSLVMGQHQIGDFKPLGQIQEVPIELQAPLGTRSNVYSLAQLPIPSTQGGTVPLYELGSFRLQPAQQPIYQQDLRPVTYVTADVQGRLSAPLYGMLEVDQSLQHYTPPGGKPLSVNWLSEPTSTAHATLKWGGAWTVTYETFLDMGIAFAVALVLIYMLVVWEFGNFVLPAIIMAPIPLTLIGILPGHWLLHADFTATSMIGFIALAGIIVRNSILLVDYSQHRVAEGMPVLDALVDACAARTRPIVITAMALAASSYFIISAPIFQGMGISLLFGVIVSTVLTLLVIPLGCVTGRAALCPASIGPNGAPVACPPVIESEALKEEAQAAHTRQSSESSADDEVKPADAGAREPAAGLQDETSSDATSTDDASDASRSSAQSAAQAAADAPAAEPPAPDTASTGTESVAPPSDPPTVESPATDPDAEASPPAAAKPKAAPKRTKKPATTKAKKPSAKSASAARTPRKTSRKTPVKPKPRGIRIKQPKLKDKPEE
ncbi:acriflavin resistance protein [Acidihalobacter ferrooxydans]|uniref:Acriflavin resistance protein n=2 Tax=Acidihalobacter ferrooxydans TaxID=1765967 RepID=A0A1P8ULC5_9GAMM|nr:acriflavin resistance protein [Acidihalobacter ferrooxydans]